MIESAAQNPSTDAVEAALQGELAHGDSVLATVTPIMRHLLGGGGGSILAEVVIAGVRGMAADLAQQLLDARARAGGASEPGDYSAAQLADLGAALTACPALVSHCHALALEWKLAQHLQARLSLDPVLSSLLQSEMASANPETAALAMRFLAAQARFCQDQRRMQLPLLELPGDLLHGALIALRTLSDSRNDALAEVAEAAIRKEYDESRSRLGLASRLVAGLPEGGLAALSLGHAGTALFLTALALGSRQDRDLVALATDESQLARLALALRACGLKQAPVEEQFLTLHPDISLPEGFEQIGPDHAAAMLAAGLAAGAPMMGS